MPTARPRIRIEDAVRALSFFIGIAGALSAARHVGPVYALGFFLLALVAMLFEYWRAFPVSRPLLTLATLLLVGVSFMRISLKNFVQPAEEALMILLAIKLLGEKKFRDHMQIYALSVFLLAGSALLSLDMIFLAYFFLLLFLLSTAMVLLTYYDEEPAMELPVATLRGIALKSAFIPLASIPLAALLFVILPRTENPVFDFLNRGGGVAAAGFSDTVGLGQVSSIQEDATVIMRVEMEKTDDAALYWRGIVLDRFDGRSWKSIRREPAGRDYPATMPGRRVAQTIYLAPYGNRYVFALDKPIAIRAPDVRRYGDLTYALTGALSRKLKYEALSVLSDTLPEREANRDWYLQLPATGMEKIRELTKSLATAGKEETAKAILHFLRDGEYAYSLTNLPASNAPLDEFLFQDKYGNCEYFASALAVMLRLSGIPSRLVGGYRGGFYSRTGGYYMIPQRNAHVWVEAYFENRGWVRLDPTPAASESFVSASGMGPLFRLRLFFDAIDYYWSVVVINYDLERQFSLINRVREGVRFETAFDRGRAFRFALLLLGAVSLGLLAAVLRRPRKSTEERMLAAFLRKMKRRGYVKPPHQGLEEFVALVREDDLRGRARRFVDRFEGHYYRDRRLTRGDAHRLKKMLAEL